MRRSLQMAGSALRLGAALASGRRLPFSMTFILTHRCNFRCDYCDIPDAAGDEMSAGEFMRAIDELSQLGLARASFSGGEALLRADAVEIIAHARKRGLMTSLNSNAWLAGEKLDALAEILDMLVISLDGPEPVHDLVRGRRGSYARVLAVLDGARKKGLATATITVLSQANLHVVDEVLALAEQHQFYAYFQPAYHDCFAHSEGVDAVPFGEIAAKLRAGGRRVGASPGYLERLARGPHFGDCSSCAAGSYFATLMPDGEMVPCHLSSKGRSWPNGRTLGFARAFRELPPPGPGPGCAISPYQESDLIFHLDPRALKNAWKVQR
jgi:MoaA/NifB/PqqE/SkfB family radical SAM enzyme